MQTPEEFAATYGVEDLAPLIRARDEAIRADERAKVLADVDGIARVSALTATDVRAILDALRKMSEPTDDDLVVELVRRGVLEEKRENLLRPVQVPCDCEHPTHARLVGDDSPLTHVTSEVVSVVRYASRWQPDTRTPQQRSDDAIDELRRRLTGDA